MRRARKRNTYTTFVVSDSEACSRTMSKIIKCHVEQKCGALFEFLCDIIDRLCDIINSCLGFGRFIIGRITFTSFEDLKQFAINLNEKCPPMNTIIEVNLFESNANVS